MLAYKFSLLFKEHYSMLDICQFICLMKKISSIAIRKMYEKYLTNICDVYLQSEHLTADEIVVPFKTIAHSRFTCQKSLQNMV